MAMDIIQDYLSLAIEVARESGDYARTVQRSELKISTKTNEMDIVTQVDSRNEQTIRDNVLAKYPDHVFLGEELGSSEAAADIGSPNTRVRWIIDPIDGTVN